MGDIYASIKHVNVLHIDGITYKDILKRQEFSDRLMFDEDDNNICIDNIEYDEIPTYFTIYRDWKKSTNLSCFNCTLTINKVPVPLCTKSEYHNNGKYVRYNVDGSFCSFNCAYAHINCVYAQDPNKNKYISILKEIYYMFYSRRISIIQPSPSRSLLKHYGGKLTPREYELCITSLQETDVFVSSNIDRMSS